MKYSQFSVQWLQFTVMVLSILITGTAVGRFDILRLSPTRGALMHNPYLPSSAAVSDDLQTFYYPQTLDHFNYLPESYATFQQRYVINFKHWGGANNSAPILAYLGAEAPLDDHLPIIGFLNDNAIRFNALLVYIEHRYYGKSIPFGSREEAYKNASTLGYFNSAQAIADYAEIIMHIKKNFNAFYSPVIVIGASYGGMLASWLRLKYPHVALGALASSAPILYFDKLTPRGAYFSVVTKDFKEASKTCYRTIRDSWSVIDKIASQPHGLAILSSKFKTCEPLKDSLELKNELGSMYAVAAQFNGPPRYPVTVVCGGIDGANEKQDTLRSHCLDILPEDETDPEWLVRQRETEVKIIQGWIAQYYADLEVTQIKQKELS
ncbi:hypothetical protein V6N11_008925 [Hibiscus sabdariffa]|uniref:Lysosomal Pro-X carboxypeptidase n=1 Tax=Hibiscus sabdariffa TaxID=183260 RepID=A0ABR2PP79_9ROSI